MKKILVILPRVPYPIEKGDKLRAYNQIKYLSQRNEIYLCALNDPGSPADLHAKEILLKFCKEVIIVNLTYSGILLNLFRALFTGLPLQIGYFYSSRAAYQINKMVQDISPDHLYCQLIRTAAYAKFHPQLTRTLDYMDALSKGIERRIPNANILWKFILNTELRRLKNYEKSAFEWFENKIIISDQDRCHLCLEPSKKDTIRVIPNGVDTDFFQPVLTQKKIDLLYCGNMNYPPNIEAALYLVNKVLPILLKDQPKLTVMIAGTNPSLKVKELASQNVNVTGWVDDIRECYGQARVFLAPMQTSIGMQNKILEAMAMKVPCITSAMANNAIEAVEGESILLGATPEEYATHAKCLLNDPQKAETLASNAFQLVNTKYSWEQVSDYMDQIFT